VSHPHDHPPQSTCQLQNNRIARIPHEIDQLSHLENLDLSNNCLEWLPVEICALLPRCNVQLSENPLPFVAKSLQINNMYDVFASMTHLEAIRRRATTICFGLLALPTLPTLVVLEIIDIVLPNDIRMKAKWDLIVAVKNRSMLSASLGDT
jgi:Leucine-rich repeat (LRR) protein